MSVTPKITFYAQFGEDARLAEIFKDKKNGTCVEIGALDGIKDSTTLYFEQNGWNCVLVEANPGLAEKSSLNRKGRVFACAAGSRSGVIELLIVNGAEYLSTTVQSTVNISKLEESKAKIEKVTVPMRQLDDILQEANVKEVDFITIDVEGAELDVLKGFDLAKWKPRVIVAEDNSGGHDLRVRRHLKHHNYLCFFNDGLNDWYAQKADYELLTNDARNVQFRRFLRKRLYEWTVGLLPLAIQKKLVSCKRTLFGRSVMPSQFP